MHFLWFPLVVENEISEGSTWLLHRFFYSFLLDWFDMTDGNLVLRFPRFWLFVLGYSTRPFFVDIDMIWYDMIQRMKLVGLLTSRYWRSSRSRFLFSFWFLGGKGRPARGLRSGLFSSKKEPKCAPFGSEILMHWIVVVHILVGFRRG